MQQAQPTLVESVRVTVCSLEQKACLRHTHTHNCRPCGLRRNECT